MNRIADSKGVYAQSSDIKSRSYIKYRFDMKRKAIIELEVVDWFESKLKEIHKTDKVVVTKGGGDAHMWFLRSGKISGKPDYVADINGEKHNFEFQCASDDNLDFYDFKVAKVGKKVKGERIPYKDRNFLYIMMPSNQFAIFSPKWVTQNSQVGGVPAWGNRTAFRVPKDKFKPLFSVDENLKGEIKSINNKIKLLEKQSFFIKNESNRLSAHLQHVIDQNKAFKVIPKTLDGFFNACFLMDQIKKYPENHSLWLVYGSTFFSNELNSRDIARLLYSLDFLYGGSSELEKNVLVSFVETMRKMTDRIALMQEQNLQTCVNLSPTDEIVNFLFVINLYEDIVQELRFLYGVDCFDPIRKIFQTVSDLDSIYEKI